MEPIKGGSLAKYSDDIEQLFKSHNKDASMASYALRWVAKFPNVKVILSGMSTMEQVKDNLDTFCNYKELTKEEEKTIEQVVSILENRVQNGCTGCRYCMPCPAQVDIPGNFSAWNTYHIYQNYDIVKWKWEQDLGDKKQAKNCVKCGKCEAECPQKISIRKDLEKLQRELDGKSI